MSIVGKPGPISRRAFLGMGGGTAAALLLGSGPLHTFGARVALGQTPTRTTGYGTPVPKAPLGSQPGDPQLIAIPPQFDYVVIDRQNLPMRDSSSNAGFVPTPGIFDGMAAFSLSGGDDDDDDDGRRERATILIRNHENRERAGEIPVVVPPDKAYDPSTIGGNTKVIVRRDANGIPQPVRPEDKFAILGGTSTNCAGGETPWGSWLACEEVVKGPSSPAPTTGNPPRPVVIGGQTLPAPTEKHGYVFEVPAYADGPVEAVPIRGAGRMAHEAAAVVDNVVYLTEDRSFRFQQNTNTLTDWSVFYRYRPSTRIRRAGQLANSRGRLEALKVKGQPNFNADTAVVGKPYRVEWVSVPVPDHNDDTDNRRVGTPENPDDKPTRFQADDRGAARFDRQEGMWVSRNVGGDDDDDDDEGLKVYFDCTAGGQQNLGQVWEFDPERQTLTLIYESRDPANLQNPDNIVIVPQTGDIFLQEDGSDAQFVRGLTPEGEIYDFAYTVTNDTEFCGGCFDPDGEVFYLNQQGERLGYVDGPPDQRAVTYAIFGPFDNRRDEDEDDD